MTDLFFIAPKLQNSFFFHKKRELMYRKIFFSLSLLFCCGTHLSAQATANKIIRYFFVELVTNPNAHFSPDTLANIQKAHLANIKHLVQQEQLLLAGPFQSGGGLFILNTKDEATAKALVESDPAVKAGRFTYKIRPWYTEKGLLTLEEGKPPRSSMQLKSAVLEEERNVLIHLPESYDTSRRAYPLLLVLDADYRFNVTHVIYDYIRYWKGLPEMIFVGIPNKDRKTRNRDLLPTTYGGQANNFLKFLEEELLPTIEQQYRISKERVIIGHSHAGVFATYTLLTKPHLFSGYVATDAGIGDLIPLLKEKGALEYEHKKLFLSTSDLGDFDQQIIEAHKGGIERFQQTLQALNPKGLSYKFSHITDDHGNAYPQSASEGLRFIFQPNASKNE